MKTLRNLSIRQKFLITLLPLVLATIYFAYSEISYNLSTSNELRQVSSSINLAASISNVVHEFQRERGASSGYLTSQGQAFSEELQRIRKAADNRIDEYQLRTTDISQYSAYAQNVISDQNEIFGRLEDLRQDVNIFKVTAAEEIRLFTEMNTASINNMKRLGLNTENKVVYNEVLSLVNFIQSKERSGIERALLTQVFTLGHFPDRATYRQFSNLVSEQQTFLREFESLAPATWNASYSKALETDAFNEDVFNKVEEARLHAFEQDSLTVDPNTWFETITGKINILKEVEDILVAHVVDDANQLAAQAQNLFFVFLVAITLLGLLVVFLIASVVRKIISNIRDLEVYASKVSKGDFKSNINIESQDEIGTFSRTLTSMVSNIQETQSTLRNTIRQSEVIFETVDQGIFLLNKRFEIGSLYSTALEKIFETGNFTGENFVQFMRPKLVTRDLDALELFMKHLFNPDVKEKVLNKLNPIENVEIFFSREDESLQSKHVRITFSRIQEGDDIQNILVTIIDETENVLLQKEIEESEEKNKQEMELMLSILKVDPGALGGYLLSAQETLDQISDRYEADDKKNFKELIDFTYRTIHTLKSNASIIDLKMLATRFHDIENMVAKLVDKELIGDDFIPVLFEIKEIKQLMGEMASLLDRVLEVSQRATENVKTDHTDFIQTLKRGAQNISRDLKKQVDLQIDAQGQIPEKYKIDIKDILTQLVRNSLVHGIEHQDERTQLGKPEKASIKIEITEKNSSLFINYMDDGKGLDERAIGEKAIADNIISSSSELSTPEDYKKLLFRSGFTTSMELSHHAGRGQGMNVVQSLTDKNDGSIDINYKTGEFFELTLQLPLDHSNQEVRQSA